MRDKKKNPQPSGWIKVSERPPPLNTEILAWNECPKCRKSEPHSHPCIYLPVPGHGAFIGAHLKYTNGDQVWAPYSNVNVTHWMPLPQVNDDDL